MTRRRLVALVSVAVLFTLGLLAAGFVLFVTRTTTGRDKFRDVIQPLIARAVHGGSVYIGHLTALSPTNVTVDSFAIRDKRGEILVSTGRVTFYFNPRDLIDQRIYITRADVEHPFVHLIQHQSGKWNFQEIFASPPSATPTVVKEINTRGFGDYIVVDSTRTRKATFLLTLAWEPDSTFKGAARDSVIRVHLADSTKGVTKTFDGYGRTFAWRNAGAVLTHARLADPDSDKMDGQLFRVDSLSVDEYEPTFKFRGVRGDIRHLGDTIKFDIAHFDMPASTGRGTGKVTWGNGPIHYDIAIHGDTVSLDDVNWVYPKLPRTGGGTLDLLIKNDPVNPRVLDYHLVNMDVRSTKSHLTGTMTFGTGQPVLLVRNVDMRADPVDFDLLRTLNGKKFTQDWQGTLLGTVKGRGGPLTHFVIDDSRGTFNDAHVKGAVSRFTGKGELDILEPAFTAFHGFDVNAGAIDLRTIEYLFPNFPRLGGIVSGTATLDSSWLDVRFSNAHLVHQDGDGEPSRVSGSGRITDGDLFVTYDMALNAEPLSLTMLARSYPNPLRGLVSGPIRVKGTTADLETVFSLQGALGAMSFDGRLDLDTVGGMGAHGRGDFSTLSPATLLQKATIPPGAFSGHYGIDVAGATAASLTGTADVNIERTEFDSVRFYPSFARLRFGDGKMSIVDSLLLRTAAGTLIARGAIGLPKGTSDSVKYDVTLDSLGGLRRYISNPDTTRLGAAATPPDSLSGTLRVRGTAAGTLDSARVSGTLNAANLYFNSERGELVKADFNVTLAGSNVFGGIAGKIDTVTLAGVLLDTIGGVLSFSDLRHATFNLAAQSRNGPSAAARGLYSKDSTGMRDLLLDSLGLSLVDDRWRLASPARVRMDSVGFRLDSLVMRNKDSAVIALAANIPETGPATARLDVSRIPLRDFGILAQLSDTLNGLGDASAIVSGTKAKPIVVGNALLTTVKWRGVEIDRVTVGTQYADTRLNANLDVVRAGKSAVTATASLPLELTLPLTTHWRQDSIAGLMKADSADLSFLQLILGSSVSQVSGRLTANITASGTPAKPVLSGLAMVSNGSATITKAGVSLTGINAWVTGGRDADGHDNIQIDTIIATTLERNLPPGRVNIKGSIKDLMQSKDPRFELTARADNFHVYNRRSVADVYISTPPGEPLFLKGSVSNSTLTGALRVDRGAIFLSDPDIARKQAVQFEFGVEPDSSRAARPTSAMMQTFMTNLQILSVPVTLGNDVRLRSKDANVKLTGALDLQTSTNESTRTLATGELVPRLGLVGQVFTEGGTYNLNLGPVQREFQVVPGGAVRFDGPPEDPILDIKARYAIRQQRDLAVVVHLGGRLLPYPKIDLSNEGTGYQLATSDLLSYLLTGNPGFDFGANPGTTQQVLSILGPTADVLFANSLRKAFGGVVDFSFSLGSGVSSAGGTSNPNAFKDALTGSTIGAEKQIGNSVFLSLNTGFCQFSSNPSTGSGLSSLLLYGVGAKAEYRFDPRLAFKLAYDPPTENRTCSQGTSLFGLAPTPANFSFSLSHVWRF